MNIIEIKKRTNLFHIYWTLTDFCNFRCNYCPKHLHSGDYQSGRKAGFPTDQQINTFLDTLTTEYLPGKQLMLAIGGGEPTLHPMLPTIVDRMSAFGETAVTTNGSRGLDWWAALPTLPTVVNISLHHEFTNLDKVNEVSHFLVNAGVNLTYNLSCDPGNWTAAVSMYEGLDNDLKCLVLPKVIHHFGMRRTTYPYTEQQRAWIKDVQRKFTRSKLAAKELRILPTMLYDNGTSKSLSSLSDMTLNEDHVYTGWECYAGQETFNIHFDGRVYSSICKQVNICHLSEFKPLTAPFICQTPKCTAPGDLLVSKRKVQ